jgi:hypothetical protein
VETDERRRWWEFRFEEVPEKVGGKVGETGEVSGADLFVEGLKGKEMKEETERLRERERA